MGLFSFVKDAGKKVFGKKEEEADADAILAEIKALGLEAEGVEWSRWMATRSCLVAP